MVRMQAACSKTVLAMSHCMQVTREVLACTQSCITLDTQRKRDMQQKVQAARAPWAPQTGSPHNTGSTFSLVLTSAGPCIWHGLQDIRVQDIRTPCPGSLQHHNPSAASYI